MKTTQTFFAAAILALALSLAALVGAVRRDGLRARAAAQQYGALERGYRTGYSDGYQSGWGDQLKGARADYRSKADYQRADRAYIAAYGSLEDYRDGYQQGFEVGYAAGYARRGFDSDLPAGGVTRRGVTPTTSRRAADRGTGATVRSRRRGDATSAASHHGGARRAARRQLDAAEHGAARRACRTVSRRT